MIQIAKGDKVELVNLLKVGGSDSMYMKIATTTAHSVMPAGVLPAIGQFVIEGDGGLPILPTLTVTFTALHAYTAEENGGLAFDSNFNFWKQLK